MGLRTAVRNLLKKVFGESLYRGFRDAYRNARYGDDNREGRVTGDLSDSNWKSVDASTYKWVPPARHLVLPLSGRRQRLPSKNQRSTS